MAFHNTLHRTQSPDTSVSKTLPNTNENSQSILWLRRRVGRDGGHDGRVEEAVHGELRLEPRLFRNLRFEVSDLDCWRVQTHSSARVPRLSRTRSVRTPREPKYTRLRPTLSTPNVEFSIVSRGWTLFGDLAAQTGRVLRHAPAPPTHTGAIEFCTRTSVRFQERFGLWTVPTTRTVRGSPEHFSIVTKPRHSTQPLSDTNGILNRRRRRARGERLEQTAHVPQRRVLQPERTPCSQSHRLRDSAFPVSSLVKLLSSLDSFLS